MRLKNIMCTLALAVLIAFPGTVLAEKKPDVTHNDKPDVIYDAAPGAGKPAGWCYLRNGCKQPFIDADSRAGCINKGGQSWKTPDGHCESDIGGE
ncbi:hypothetical protein C4J81_19140 (plasmid) [Deltaproteobacteria bacterium Smac51]|nr:hypothetical protein C4J81_19140 [Deltaproteobacteria bacterium Smac51]